MEINGNVYCLSKKEINQLTSETVTKFIYFENIRKGDFIDDGYVGFEAIEDSQVFECVNCGNKWEEEGHKCRHKQEITCSSCGISSPAYNLRYGRKTLKQHANLVAFGVQDNNNVWAECVRVEAEDFTDIYDPKFISFQRRALYHFTPGNAVKYKYDYNRSESYLPTKAKTGYRFYNNMGSVYCQAEYYEIIEENDRSIDDTFLKYSCYSTYSGDHYEGHLLRYMMMYCEAPVFCEFFTKVGAYSLVTARIEGGSIPKNINYRAKTIKELFRGLEKPKVKALIAWLAEHKSISTDDISCAVSVLKSCPTECFKKLAALFGNYVGVAVGVLDVTKQSPITLSNYLKKQNAYISTYEDYINDCVKLGYDLSSSIVLYPKNLMDKHAETSGMARYSTNTAEIEKSKKRAKALKKRGMEYSHGRLCALVPADSIEIIREGALLQHCVGGYAKRHAEGTTTIIFIRKRSDISTPYFTLELDEKTGAIKQCYGYKNRVSYKGNMEVFQFLEHYQRHIEYCRNKHRKERKTA